MADSTRTMYTLPSSRRIRTSKRPPSMRPWQPRRSRPRSSRCSVLIRMNSDRCGSKEPACCRASTELRARSEIEAPFRVMPALVAGIHVFLEAFAEKAVDGRDKPGHDSRETVQIRAERALVTGRERFAPLGLVLSAVPPRPPLAILAPPRFRCRTGLAGGRPCG